MDRLLVASALCLSCFAVAWQTDLTVNLAWPVIQAEGTITANGGQLVGPDDTFPCASIPVPANVVRTPFPITGGRLQFDVTNSTASQSRFPGYTFISDSYLGQFSNDITANKSGWAALSTDVFKGMDTGPQCTDDTLNITQKFVYDPPPFLTLSTQNLEGVNVTLALRIVLFGGPLGDDNEEEIFQCSSLTLTSADAPITQPRGVCNRGPSPSSVTGSVPGVATSLSPNPSLHPSTSAPTPPPSPTSTPSSPPPPPPPYISSNPHSPTTLAVSIAVPAVCALAGLIGTCFYLLRRRKAKGSPTVVLDFFVCGTPVVEDVVVGDEKEKETTVVDAKDGSGKKGKASVSESESIHSEPLPVYDREGK